MRNANKFSVENRSKLIVELTLSWMSGSQKVTQPYSVNLNLFELDDNTKITVEGKLGNNPTFLTFNYKHNASPLIISVYEDGTYSIN